MRKSKLIWNSTLRLVPTFGGSVHINRVQYLFAATTRNLHHNVYVQNPSLRFHQLRVPSIQFSSSYYTLKFFNIILLLSPKLSELHAHTTTHFQQSIAGVQVTIRQYMQHVLPGGSSYHTQYMQHVLLSTIHAACIVDRPLAADNTCCMYWQYMLHVLCTSAIHAACIVHLDNTCCMYCRDSAQYMLHVLQGVQVTILAIWSHWLTVTVTRWLRLSRLSLVSVNNSVTVKDEIS